MGDFWIRDDESRVLGPVALQVVLDLVASGRLRAIAEVSEDGEHWSPIDEYPAIAEMQSRAGGGPGEKARSEAARLREQLQALQGRPPHQLFGLSPDATVEAFREAFFRLVKRFYPDSLPSDASPELRAVYRDIVDYLSRLMRYIEKLPPTEAKKAAPPPLIRRATPVPTLDAERASEPAPVSPPPAAAPKPPAAAPKPAAAAPKPPAASPPPTLRRVATCRPEDFVGIEWVSETRLKAQVQVTEESWPLISSNPLASVANGCAFVPSAEPVALGSRVDLCLQFTKISKEIAATGTVISWNAGSQQQPRGFGVQLNSLSDEDRSFLKGYAKGAAAGR